MQHTKRKSILLLLIFLFIISFHCKKEEKTEKQEQPKEIKLPSIIKVEKQGLYPEGVTYDSEGKRYFISSLREGVVLEVKNDGTFKKFIEDGKLVSTISVKVDQKRDRLLVCNSDPGVGVKTSKETQKKIAGLGIFDLKTGKKIKYYELEKLNPNDAAQFCNDMTVDSDGNIYITNSFAPVIYKVSKDGKASIFLQNDRFLGEGFNLNGIVYHPNGYLIVAKYNEGILFKIPIEEPNNFMEVLSDKIFVGADGLILDKDENLIVIANTETNKIFHLSSKNEWESSKLLSEIATEPNFPTTGTTVGDQYYYIESKLNNLFAGNTNDSFFEIKKIQFSKPEKATE